KYHWLADFDRAMIDLARRTNLLAAPPAQCLYIDHGPKILVAERGNLIFVFNFSVGESLFGYPIRVPGGETRGLALDTDDIDFGGHGRIDPAAHYPVDAEGVMKIYSPARSAQVFMKL
ncbi:MAG: alpha amylase C-terminal domain-containing protein, partial [Akkermansiaceae bacterium]|nr:alpha amylase C-terminal domain-containing protein [Akkermansiaceae bacterium]